MANHESTLAEILAWLEVAGSQEGREKMRGFGIPDDRAFGVPVGALKKKAKSVGRDHALALALWKTGLYEARILAVELTEPHKLTEAVMDSWCTEFDNWAICDHACFTVFDRTPFAWKKVREWAQREEEFVRRAGFALIWSLSVHDKAASDETFLDALALIAEAPADDRPLVKKGIDMALRAVGKRNAHLNLAARDVASTLSAAPEPARQWIGRHALRELESGKVLARLRR